MLFTSLFDGDGEPNAGAGLPKLGLAAKPPRVGNADVDDEVDENAFEPKIG